VRSTVGNLNNHFGVPLTLLALNEGDNCAVVEMGMNHAGEIAPLCAIAQPDAAIITNVGVAHIEFMGSRAAIAQEKGVLAEAVHENGLVVLNADDEFSTSIAGRTKAMVLTAGIGTGHVRATPHERSAAGTHFALQFPDGKSANVFLPVPGMHMVSNAALAAACAWHHGVTPDEIADALPGAQLTKGRVQVKIVNGITFIDDHYNANPDSMKAGLRTLADISEATRRIAVLGRMGELGAHAEQGHREVGEYAANAGVDAVFTVGPEAGLISESAHSVREGITARHFDTHAECAAHLRDWLQSGDAVLVKGSRSAGMEKISEFLQS
jgi:UDP-N-acetylmuramoyl-tripeptide--D-alanyl-D-alanine ligase